MQPTADEAHLFLIALRRQFIALAIESRWRPFDHWPL
jgi:hypothetical protein